MSWRSCRYFMVHVYSDIFQEMLGKTLDEGEEGHYRVGFPTAQSYASVFLICRFLLHSDDQSLGQGDLRLVSTLPLPTHSIYSLLTFVMRIFKICCNNFQVHGTLLLTIVNMVCFRTLEFTHLHMCMGQRTLDSTNSAALSGYQAPGVLLSLALQLWDYRCMSLHLILYRYWRLNSILHAWSESESSLQAQN